MEISITILTLILTVMGISVKRIFTTLKILISLIIGYWLFIQYNLIFSNDKYIFTSPKYFTDSMLIDSFIENNNGYHVIIFSIVAWVLIYHVAKFLLELCVNRLVVFLKKHDSYIRALKAGYFRKMKKGIRSVFIEQPDKLLNPINSIFPYKKIKDDLLDIAVISFSVVIAMLITNGSFYALVFIYAFISIVVLIMISIYKLTDEQINDITKREFIFARNRNKKSLSE